MSYNTRIYTTGLDHRGRRFTVRLMEKDYMGTAQRVAAARVPFTVTQGTMGGDPFDAIKGTEISYFPYASTPGEFDFILGASETDFMLEVEMEAPFEIYSAFVYNDLYEEDANVFPIPVTITGGDGLGRLPGKDYPIHNEVRTMAQVIDDCLKEGGQDLPVVVVDDLHDSAVTPGAEYSQIDIDDSVFTQRGLVMNCRDVLKEVLETKGVSISQAWTTSGNMVWLIYRRELLDSATLTGDLYIDGDLDDIVNIPGKISHEDTLTGVTTRKRLAPRQLNRRYDHGVLSDNFVRNGSFERFTAGVADGWTYELPAQGDIEVSDEEAHDGDFSLKLTQSGGDSFRGRAVASAGVALLPKTGPVGGLRITFSVLGQEPGVDPGVRVLLDGQVWNFLTGQTEADTGQLSVLLIGINEWRTYTFTINEVPEGPIVVELLSALPPNINDTVTTYFDDVKLSAFNLPAGAREFQGAEATLSRVTRTGEDTGTLEEWGVGLGDGPTPFSRRSLRVGDEQTGDWDGDGLGVAVLKRRMAQTRTANKIQTGVFVHPGPVWRAVDYRGEVSVPNYVHIQDIKLTYYQKEIEQLSFDASGLSSQIIPIIPESPTREGGSLPSGGTVGSVVESIDGERGNLETDITGSEGVDFTGSVVSGGQVKLADSGVTEQKIADGAVTNAKLANSSLTVNTGTGLTGGGSISLGGSREISFDVSYGDGRYGRLSAANTWTELNTFTQNLRFNGSLLAGTSTVINSDRDYTGRHGDFSGDVTLGNPATEPTHAVRADRTLRMLSDADSVVSWSPSTAQNLTANREFTPTFANAGVAQRGVVSTGAQTFGGDKTFADDLKITQSSEFISSEGFTHGFTGSGFRKRYEDDQWELELDRIWIRRSLFATEFIINQISAINGSDILSAGAGKVEEVSGPVGGIYTVTVSDTAENPISPFVLGDIIRIQQVSPDAFSGGGQILKSIDLEVLNVSGNIVDVEAIGTPGGDIAVGDVMVVIASSVTARQSAIYRTVTEADSPFVRVMTGLSSNTSLANPANTVVQYGKLDNLQGEFSEVSGFGLFVKDRFYARIGNTNVMTIGRDAGGSGKHGVRIGDNDFWYGDRTFSFAGGILNGTSSAVNISGFRFSSDRFLTESTIDPGIAGVIRRSVGSSQIVFFAGSPGGTGQVIGDPTGSKFSVTAAGDAHFGGDVEIAGDANVSGTFTNDDGSIEITHEFLNVYTDAGVQFVDGATPRAGMGVITPNTGLDPQLGGWGVSAGASGRCFLGGRYIQFSYTGGAIYTPVDLAQRESSPPEGTMAVISDLDNELQIYLNGQWRTII